MGDGSRPLRGVGGGVGGDPAGDVGGPVGLDVGGLTGGARGPRAMCSREAPSLDGQTD